MVRDENSKGRHSEKLFGEWGAGFAVGLVIGILLGISIDNLGAGIAIGAGVGVALAAAFTEDGKRRKKRRADRDIRGS